MLIFNYFDNNMIWPCEHKGNCQIAKSFSISELTRIHTKQLVSIIKCSNEFILVVTFGRYDQEFSVKKTQ